VLLAYPKTGVLVSIVCYTVGTSDLLPPNKDVFGAGL
jgi:hypothetical protein